MQERQHPGISSRAPQAQPYIGAFQVCLEQALPNICIPIIFRLDYNRNMADTEKVSFNISVVDLGKIDLLVEQGHYASRTDFLVAAVRTQLLTHAVTVQELVARQSTVVGATIWGRKPLEQLLAQGKQLDISVVGLCMFTKDVTPELALAAVRSLKVRGTLRASPEVKAALRERMPSVG